MSNKKHLGDGLYADSKSGWIIITTKDGDEVYLDPSVAKNLVEYINKGQDGCKECKRHLYCKYCGASNNV